MIDHLGIAVRDIAASTAFYEQALAPLGYKVLMKFPQAAGFGKDGKPDFWIGQAEGDGGGRTHVAFVTDRKSVDAFHGAALAAGGTDHGAPGIRAHYHPHYYGAFVKDLDGHNIEAVCHYPSGAKPAAKKAAKPAAKKAAKKSPKKAPKKAASKKAPAKKASKPKKH
jgi:catechol 2,3-dioxygenase-like lactoylglutathione lyase family enzyme